MTSALERLDRILAMVPWLLARPGVPIDEVAERFGATPSQIAADLDVLGYCGVPGYGGGDLIEVSVVGDEVTVSMADFFRRPLRLDLREAMTLLLAGRALLAAPQLGEAEALRRAVGKLEDAMGAANVAVELSASDPDLLARLRRAVEEGQVLRLRYRSAKDERETARIIEPSELVAAGGSWYLRGHCRDADAARDFRVDRIREAVPTGETVEPDDRQRPQPPGFVPHDDDLDVVLEIDPEAAWLVDAVPGATVPEPGRLRLPARSGEWPARLVLGLGGAARVIAPPEVAERVRELAAAASARYGDG